MSNHIDYTLSDDLHSASCKMSVELYNSSNNNDVTDLKIYLDGLELHNCVVKVDAGERYKYIYEFQLENVSLWDINKGNMYDVYVKTDTDDLADRIGFRKIATHDGNLYLNNRQMEIRGVNRHEEYPEFGFAFPKSLMKRDIDIILDMGCNAIRGSHYPNSQDFVDFLDENGILFWSEIPIWGEGFSVDALADKAVFERGKIMLEEMLEQYYNHPCIIIWGMHNEIKTETEAAYNMSKDYYSYLKSSGGNRLVVYASNRAMEDICFEFTDVICINQYLGWYGDSIESWEGFLDDFEKRRNELGFSTKPVIISEFGGAALYGCHDDENIMWSEEYQAKLISHCLRLFHRHSLTSGCFIWQFCDIRTSREASINRARGFNNKGLLNEHRKPKLAYYSAQNEFRK